MSYSKIRLYSILLMLVCALSLLIVNYYPTGNFIGGPAIILFVYVPLGIINLIVSGFIWSGRAKSLQFNSRLLRVSGLITLIFVGLLIYYILSNPV